MLEKERGVVGGNGGWVADWVGCGIERRVESGGMKVEKRMLIMKYSKDDNLPYCGEYLSVNSEECSVAAIVEKRKNIAKTCLFKGYYV